MKTTIGKNVAIASGIICILLLVSLVGAIANYTSIINAKDTTNTNQAGTISSLNAQINSLNSQLIENSNTIASLNSQITDKNIQIEFLTSQNIELQKWLTGNLTALNTQISELQNQVNTSTSQILNLQNQASQDKSTIAVLEGQVSSANSQITTLNAAVTTLQNKLNTLTATINQSNPQLQTLVFHVSEKGEGYTWGHLPDANATYNQILSLNNGKYNVLLLPEYQGHLNWTEELAWLGANFGGKNGIPIMLDVFGGGNTSTPTPMLSIDEIYAAMATCNVKYLRFAEVTSWHMENSQFFPTAYVTSILEFCRANNLKLFWTEWKTDALPNVKTFTAIQTYITVCEDLVTVSFSTNSQDLPPSEGFTKISQMYQNWGASIQAWYWTTKTGSDLMDMPPSLLIQHALTAKNTGAQILQFEPYWYFFDNGQPNENLKLLETMLTS
jgi:peptidoglycan hydrolase CwlO-like protein